MSKGLHRDRRKRSTFLLMMRAHEIHNQGKPFSSSTGEGARCHYCGRRLKPSYDPGELAARREHINPKSSGAKVRVWACKKCDVTKGDMPYYKWVQFMRKFPNWWTWKIFPEELEDGRRSRDIRKESL